MIDSLKAFFSTLPDNVMEFIWTFLAGSVLTFFRSIIDGTRRSAKALMLGCLFGGLGATIAYDMFATSDWRVFWTGCAAVITENFVVGLFNASKRFRESPIEVFKELWGAVTPGLAAVKEYVKRDEPTDSKSDKPE